MKEDIVKTGGDPPLILVQNILFHSRNTFKVCITTTWKSYHNVLYSLEETVSNLVPSVVGVLPTQTP